MDESRIGVLVDLVASKARVDKTEPDPGNVRLGWHTDWLLTVIDAFVVGQEKDPAAYAEIGRSVMNQKGISPEATVLAGLAMFRGERLLPQNKRREQELMQMLMELEGFISELPDGTRKLRCQSLFEYHAGVFYNAYGRYDIAAEAQGQSAVEAERFGDLPGAAIGRFMEVFYGLKHALCAGKSKEELAFHFGRLEMKFAELTKALRGTMLEVQWAQGNGPTHMIQACVWLDRGHPKLGHWVATALSAAEKLGKAFAPGAELIRAIDLAYRDYRRADKALTVIAESDDNNERKATALLVLARRAISAGYYDEAGGFYNQMPENGAQHVRAAAKKLF